VEFDRCYALNYFDENLLISLYYMSHTVAAYAGAYSGIICI